MMIVAEFGLTPSIHPKFKKQMGKVLGARTVCELLV